MQENQAVLYETTGPVALVTMNRPERLNVLDAAMIAGLTTALEQAASDPAVRAVILRGAGKAFMAGGDLRVFAHLLDQAETAETSRQALQGEIEQLVHDAHRPIEILHKMGKPVLAVIRGACAGYGLSLAMACDLAIAAEDSLFSLAYIHIGTSPDGGSTWHLPRLIGLRKAMELTLLGERFDAKTAHEMGLVNFISAAEAIEETAAHLAMRLANGPTAAYAKTRSLLRQSFQNDLQTQLQAEATQFAASALTQDFKSGVTAFLNKQKPDFKGE